jgi:hypothetical protein
MRLTFQFSFGFLTIIWLVVKGSANKKPHREGGVFY